MRWRAGPTMCSAVQRSACHGGPVDSPAASRVARGACSDQPPTSGQYRPDSIPSRLDSARRMGCCDIVRPASAPLEANPHAMARGRKTCFIPKCIIFIVDSVKPSAPPPPRPAWRLARLARLGPSSCLADARTGKQARRPAAASARSGSFLFCTENYIVLLFM